MILKSKYRLAAQILFLAGLLITLNSNAQTTFFSDQCDDATAWTLGAGTPGASFGEYTAWKMGNVGNNVGSTIDGSCLGLNAWNKLNNGIWLAEYVETAATDIIAKRTINAANYQTLQLQFDWISKGENVGSTIYDYGQVGYSTNGGSTFTWLTTGGTGNGGKYYGAASIVRNQSVTLPTALNNTSFVLGFRWINNATNGTFPGFTIDNIRINGLRIGGGAAESSKLNVLLDECKNDKDWILGKGPLFDGYTYTAWRIGNDSLCSIDYGTLAVEAWNEGGNNKWTCGYVDFISADIIANKKVDASNYESMELQFDWSGVGESNPYYLFDYGQVGYSLNNGASYTWFSTGGADAQGRYFACPTIQRGQKIILPSILDGKEFLLAFRWINDGSVEGIPGFIVDNIKIFGSPKAKQLTTIFRDNFDSRTAWKLKKANADASGNTLGWNIDRRCSIDGNSLSINLFSNTTKQWTCGFATTAAADIVASRPISAIGASNLFLKFDWKVTSTTTTDYAQIGYSTDGGVTFTWLPYGGTANSGKYYNQSGLIKQATVKLPASLDGKAFDLGIRWVNDAATNSGQAMLLDNISVVAETGIPPSQEQPKVSRITTEYVKVSGKKTESDVNALTEDGKIVEKVYLDGKRRNIQAVSWKASPAKTDVVQVRLFDENGNDAGKYLPYNSTTTDAGYHSDMFNEQYNYNNTARANFVPTPYPFAQSIMENSPANRIKEKGSIGEEFQPGLPGTSSRTVVQKFYTAIDNNPPNSIEAIKWITLSGNTLTVDYYSSPGEHLLITEVIDEDKKIKRTYSNNRGMVILERRYATNGTTILTQTYNVYDKFDRLRVVIQPEGLVAATAIPTTYDATFMDKYCFQYNYDERGRLSAKKSPGGSWMEYAYDRWDRLVVTQDANQKIKAVQEFTYVKYDAQNRPIASGTFTAANRTLTIATVRTELANTSLGARFETRTLGTLPNMDFTNNLSYPKADATNNLTVLTQNYYDDYLYTDLASIPFSAALSYTASSPFKNPTGAITGTRVKVLGTSNWTTYVNYYDQYNRQIQQQYTNINSVMNIITNEYDFQGRLLKKLENNKLTTTTGVTLLTTNQYDHVGRMTRTLHSYNGSANMILADYKYRDLGDKMSEKNVHGGTSGASYLQSVDYTFNEKGWLVNINKADLSNGGNFNNDVGDIFGMEFRYYKGTFLDASKAVYNGNIAEVSWKTTANNQALGYIYTYDDLNRLTSATYRNATTTAANNRFNIGAITYDASGNIKTLQQNGILTGTSEANYTYGLIDNLTYTYTGNRLFTVTDAVTATTSAPNDFQNGTNTAGTQDYGYDENKNMISDDNRKITSITYNFLNLPEQVVLSNGKKTVYTYDATGNKLRKQEYNGATLTRTDDYVGTAQYLNGALAFATTNEGRLTNNAGVYRYDYFMKDQNGNIRMIYTANGSSPQILQSDDYYPLGNTFNSFVSSSVGVKNNYLFNGMEYQENDLGTIDFNARMYDPQLGRTFQLDPMADLFVSLSPYSFLMNNPVRFVDPTGMYAKPADDMGDGEGFFGTIGPDGTMMMGSWFLNSGGYTSVSLKWRGVVYDREHDQYYYKGRAISPGYARELQLSGRVSYYSPFYIPGTREDRYDVDLHRFDYSLTQATIVVSITPVYFPVYKHGVIGDWAGQWQNGLGAADFAWGAKEELINYAAKIAPAINTSNYYKVLKPASHVLFYAQAAVSTAQAISAWRQDDNNKWGVTGKAALDVTMGYIGLVGGPAGWAISGAYFLCDAAGLFDSWSKPTNKK